MSQALLPTMCVLILTKSDMSHSSLAASQSQRFQLKAVVEHQPSHYVAYGASQKERTATMTAECSRTTPWTARQHLSFSLPATFHKLTLCSPPLGRDRPRALARLASFSKRSKVSAASCRLQDQDRLTMVHRRVIRAFDAHKTRC